MRCSFILCTSCLWRVVEAGRGLRQQNVIEEARNESRWRRWSFFRRSLFEMEGSDCLESGGGQVPFFKSCMGCPIGSAQQCVLDMRRNVSFNVPSDCNIGQVSMSAGNPNGNLRCCAKEDKEETYAYPDAFRCLHNLRCESSGIYTELKRECDSLCPHFHVWDNACEPTEISGAVSSRKISLLILLLPFLLSFLFLFSFQLDFPVDSKVQMQLTERLRPSITTSQR